MRAVNKTAQVPMIGFPLLFSVADPGSGAGGSRLGGGLGSQTPFTSYLFDKH